MDAHELCVGARHALRGADPRTAMRLSAEIRETGAECDADAVEVEARVALGAVPWAMSFGDASVTAARDRLDPGLGVLLAAAGRAALAAGEVYSARELFTEAERRLDPADQDAQAELQLSIARLSLLGADPAAAEERAAAALGIFTDADDPIGCGLALLVAAEARRATGDARGAREVTALAAERLSDVRGGPAVRLGAAEAEQALSEGNGSEALRLARRALGRLAHADVPLCARLWTAVGDAHDQVRAAQAALHAWRTAASMYESGAGDGTVPLTQEALAWLIAGRTKEASARLRLLLDRAERAGRTDRLEVLHVGLLACAAATGDWESWDQHLQRAEGLAPRTVVHQTVAAAHLAADRCTQVALAGGDPHMLSRAVRAGALLLHACERLGRSAEALAAARVLADLGAKGAPIPAGPFDLAARVGAGAMGAVWSARHHERPLDVAVKLLPPAQVGDQRWDALLASEIRSVAALDHPNIVHILGTGRLGSASEAVGHGAVRVDSPWFAMELAADGTLESLCGKLDWRGCRGVLLALLDALAHAHARGVIHLDLKPSNVLLRAEPDGRKRVLLSDFGLARVWAHTHGGAWVAGTPYYMAPEQFQSESRDVGPRTDLYGLGCLAWHLVTGDIPFEGETAEELRRQHTAAALPELRPKTPVPDGFEAWVLRLLAKRPAERFTTAAEAAWALRQLRLGGPSEVGPRPVPTHWEGPAHVGSDADGGADTALAMTALRRPPLVGRREQRDRMWGVLRQACEERRAAVLLLTGAPGMGKTELARWFAERVLELGAAEVLDAGTGTDGQQGLRALAQRALRLDGLSAEVATERVRERFPDLTDDVVTGLGILAAEHGVALQGSERVSAVVALVARVASERPVVVRLAPDRPPDRDQLAVAVSLAALDAPIVVVVEGADPDADPAFEAAARVSLERMTDDDIGALLDARLPLVPLLRSRVVALAAGRPDVAVRCIADLVARDLLFPTAEGCALRVDVAIHGERSP